MDRRKKDVVWNVADESGAVYSYDRAALAVLMDLRDELKKLNSLLHCSNFISIPEKLNAIRRNTSKPGKNVQ